MDLYIKKFSQQYQKQYPLYEDFCLLASKLLSEYLEKKGYKHQIYCRLKNPGKLKEKLARKKLQQKIYLKLCDIEDLAGVRIVFYLKSDKNNFLKNFNHNFLRILSIKNMKKSNGYRAGHMIIAPSRRLLAKKSFKKFSNFRCEIQITWIFDHVWSELEHDWIYKDVRGLKQSNPQKYQILKRQMKHIFEKYIKKIGMRFEKVARQLV